MTAVPVAVMQVVDTLEPGGRERLVVDLANGLATTFRSHVCESRGSGGLGADLDAAVTRIELGRAQTWDLKAMKSFAHYVRDHDISIIHSHGRAVMQFVAIVKLLFRLHVVHVFHDHAPGVDASAPAPLSLRAPAHAAVDGLIAVSDELAAWARLQLRFRDDRVWVVRNAISLERFEAVEHGGRDGSCDEAPVLVAVANVREQKDIETLLRAVKAMSTRARLVVVGSEGEPRSTYAQRCRDLADALGIQDRVIFAGTQTDIPAILARSDVGVLSSRHESGPLVVAEYVAAGLPVVATATGPITLALSGRRVARVVPVGDAASFATALDEMLALLATQRDELRREARATAHEMFSMSTVVSAVAAIYESLLVGHRRRIR